MKVVLKFPWNTLIDTALKTQKNYLYIDEIQLEWLKEELYNIYGSNLDINLKYKCLVLLNRSIKCGRYALLFNKKIEEAVLSKDKNLLESELNNPSMDELNCLSNEEKTKWLTEINNHVLALNLYMDRLIISQNKLYTFQNENVNTQYTECYQEVCNKENIDTLDIVYFSDYNKYNELFFILEIDLIFLLLSKSKNPYSNKNFSSPLLNIFYVKYRDVLLVCKEAFKLGYKHVYKI